MWSRTSRRSGPGVCGDRGGISKGDLIVWQNEVAQSSVRWSWGGGLTSNRSTVDEPVAVLPIALVGTNSAGIDHGDRVASAKGHGRVNGRQREVRSVSNICGTIQSRTIGDQP